MTFCNLPDQLKNSHRLVLWREIPDKNGKLKKSPISNCGRAIGYNSPDALVTFEEAKDQIKKDEDIGLGITLLEGLKIKVGRQEGYLECFDFDGFADPYSLKVDPGVLNFLRKFPSYTEISPSETGFKYLFISDRPPSTKSKIKFGPSSFSEKYPHIHKHAHREVELFSKNLFLALTGDCFNSKLRNIEFYDNAKVEEAIQFLNQWAISSGGLGHQITSTDTDVSAPAQQDYTYTRLSPHSLKLVLGHVDHWDEQIWSDTCNALARVYGEDGRPYFVSYSAGENSSEPYTNYDEGECNDRFDRALEELHARPNGYGVKYLIKLASSHPDWLHPDLEYEVVSPFSDETKAKKKFNFLTTTELANKPPLTWRVKGLLPDRGIASIYGASGSGKSFLALDLMAAVVRSETFYGSKTNQCPVVYVALEGTGGIANRIKAYETHHKVKLPSSFRVVTDMLSLFNSDAEIFAEAVKEEGLNEGVIVIDTLAQSAPGTDENSSADMGKIISNAQALQKATDGLVVLVHHTGKDARRGARGHSSFGAALDAGIEVKRTQGGREWRRAKVKDGEDGLTYHFNLEPVFLGIDEDGDEITSCVAVGDYFRTKQPKAPTGKHQNSILNALRTNFTTKQWIPVTDVLALAESALPEELRNKKQRIKEALDVLVQLEHIEQGGDEYKIL